MEAHGKCTAYGAPYSNDCHTPTASGQRVSRPHASTERGEDSCKLERSDAILTRSYDIGVCLKRGSIRCGQAVGIGSPD